MLIMFSMGLTLTLGHFALVAAQRQDGRRRVSAASFS